MKKLVFFMMVFFLVFSTSVSVFASTPVNGRATVIISSKYDTSKLTTQQIQELEKANWKVTEDGLNFSAPLTGELLINGEVVQLNSDGTFYVEGSPESIKIQHDGKNLEVKKNKEGFYVFNYVVDWDSAWDAMDNIHKNDENGTPITINQYYKKYKPGDKVHCNRFNGPLTDDVHYPKTHWRAYVNFAGSDCQLAITSSNPVGKLCALDYTSSPWCNGSGGPAACSKVIGHSTKYHRH